MPVPPVGRVTELRLSQAGVGGGRMAGRPGGRISVARALGSPTRAGIYERLRTAGEALTVRDIAGAFDLHPNVARTHLETLAEAGLVSVGRRKHPGGGRPAKVYTVAPDATGATAVAAPAGVASVGFVIGLLVALVEELDGHAPATGGGSALPGRAHELAAQQGRRLMAGLPWARTPAPSSPPDPANPGPANPGPANPGPADRAPGDLGLAVELDQAAQLAVLALRSVAPDARMLKAGKDWVDIAGVRGALTPLSGVHPELAEVFERGLLYGALAGAGVPATLAEAGTTPGGGPVLRVRRGAPASARAGAVPAGSVDTRGQQRETGVVEAMRAITGLRRGEVLEVLAEGPGSPAAFARWADRAGHVLLGVDRASDPTGRSAIRLLIRKGA